jgi:hypothetical protein
MMKVVVTAATKHRATAEIAAAIGEGLGGEHGLDATVVPPEQVVTVAGYDAVVLGSAVCAGHWLAPAKELVDRAAGALAGKPVWLFSSGPVGDPPKPEEDPVDVAEIVATAKARKQPVVRRLTQLARTDRAPRLARSRSRSRGGEVMPVRERARMTAEVLVASPRFLTAPLYRHWHLRWGATNAEVALAMPGDAMVPDASFTATRAITIAAPPELVWPWIVQIGTGRAGFYSYDLFDNAARPSADRILPQCQETQLGDWVPMSSTVNQTTAFRVKAFQPNQWLLWAKPHSTWAWTLTPVNGGTRLVTRLKEQYLWRSSPGLALLTLILLEFGDFPMMRRLLVGIRQRAERLNAERVAAAPIHHRHDVRPSANGPTAASDGLLVRVARSPQRHPARWENGRALWPR